MSDDSNLWIGYLTSVVLQKTLALSLQRCAGCKAKLKSPLLHQHEQYSLLDKLHTYFNEVRGDLLANVNKLFDAVKERLPASDDESKDKENYTTHARFYLQNANPEIIYYGRFLTDDNDEVISELHLQKTKTPRKRKTVTESKGGKQSPKKQKEVPPGINLEALLEKTYRDAVTSNMTDSQYYF